MKEVYRIQTRVGKQWQGIQGINIANNNIITGGNIIHQICYWHIKTGEDRRQVLRVWQKDFPKYPFRLV